ncbi:MAG: S9 family peptidase, partial [Dehalococcoidia bacterium]|nr:S9 family peptidase [Dehalococcoidia bacterium]
MKDKNSPFGSWESPISAKIAAESGITFEDLRVSKNKLVWLEGRPYEAGRYVTVGRDINSNTKDLIPNGYNVRNAVHEYGGASYAIHDDLLIF